MYFPFREAMSYCVTVRGRIVAGLCLVVVLALVSQLAMMVYQARTQCRLVEEIRELGGTVIYEYQTTDIAWEVDENAVLPVPGWACALLGKDCFVSVTAVSVARVPRDTNHDLFVCRLARTMPSLERLRLKASSLTNAGAERLGDLSGLVELDIGASEIDDAGLAFLSRLSRLRALRLFKVTDEGMRHIAVLSDLRDLRVRVPHGITDCGLSRLATLSNLEKLSLSPSAITGTAFAHFAHLSRLQTLDLSPHVDNNALKHLARAGNLRELNIHASRVTDSGIRYLRNMRCLRVLDLSFTKVSDSCLADLSRMRGLEELNLAGTRVKGTELAHLSENRALRKLDLAWTECDDRAMHALENCVRLQKLSLNSTEVTDHGLDALGSLKNLTSLMVTGPGITHSGGAALARRLPHCVIGAKCESGEVRQRMIEWVEACRRLAFAPQQ